jgi:hypothetical protein
MSGCITRDEIDAVIFLNNGPLPSGICDREPELKKYGFYRTLNSGKFEFMSFCHPKANKFLSAREDDLNEILDKTLPKQQGLNQ